MTVASPIEGGLLEAIVDEVQARKVERTLAVDLVTERGGSERARELARAGLGTASRSRWVG